MNPHSSPRVQVWDGWRGLAILLVLTGHFADTGWIWEERMGVDVFFVLSGMLMSNILFVKRMALRDFYIRRVSRVMPALIVFLVGSYVVSLIMHYDFQVVELFASLFFIRTYYPEVPAYFMSDLPTRHLWSLNVEEHSYVIMSILSLLLYFWRGLAAVLLLIYCAATFMGFYYLVSMPAAELGPMLFRTETTIGFIAFSAAYCLIKRNREITLNPWISMVLLFAALLCYLTTVPVWFTFLLCPILLGVAVNHLVDSPKLVVSILSSKPLVHLGVLSYSIYLWQQIFYKLHYAFPYGPVTGLILSLIFGALSFYIIENPARKYINQRWSPAPKTRNLATE